MSARTVGVILDETFCRHQTPEGHPERPDRIRSLLKAAHDWPHSDSLRRLPPTPTQEEVLTRVHSPRHLQAVKDTAGQTHRALDPDTHTSPDSYQVALLAAGSTLSAVAAVLAGDLHSALVLARPPGHHAESDRPMGFCLFNNIALAAQDAVGSAGLDRVAVVDFDVHHGNGTEEIFYGRSDVLYVSNHQYPFYPGTGAATDRGLGEGAGFTCNLPMPAGVGDDFVLTAYSELVLPALDAFQPELILVSAGFDAHRLDPLGGLEMTAAGFGALAGLLIHSAEAHCGGRIAFVLEGGYSLEGLTAGVEATLRNCLTPSPEIDLPAPPDGWIAYRKRIEDAWG